MVFVTQAAAAPCYSTTYSPSTPEWSTRSKEETCVRGRPLARWVALPILRPAYAPQHGRCCHLADNAWFANFPLRHIVRIRMLKPSGLLRISKNASLGARSGAVSVPSAPIEALPCALGPAC